MTRVLLTAGGIGVLVLMGHLRVERLRAGGHLRNGCNQFEVAWVAFVAPALRVLWAGAYEMVRTAARGTRQKPPFGAFMLAWLTGRVQSVTKVVRVTDRTGQARSLRITEQVRPPRPPGRPRKYSEGWRQARLTGRPRGRPRKAVAPSQDGGGGHEP